jgi:hypothetical protein
MDRPALHDSLPGEDEATVLKLFDPGWESLPSAEQAGVIGLVVERVDYDGAGGKLTIALRAGAVGVPADEHKEGGE